MPPKPKSKPTFPAPAAVLPGEAEMLAAVVADPGDETAKLAYADWLEERDDPRGPFLREQLVAVRAGEKLPTPKFAPRPWLDLVGLSLLRKINIADLTEHTDKFLRLARPALTFEPARAADKILPVGTSKFGGGPDMPPDAAWPEFWQGPLAFLAQFNLADLSASLVCRELPKTGLLSVFCAWDEDEGNDDLGDKQTWRLFYFPDPSKLARRLPPETSFNPCRLAFSETLTMPDRDSPWKRELGLGKDYDIQIAYSEGVSGYGEGHTLLGYPAPIQNDVLGKKTVRHLLTICSDDDAGWMWGDGGSLYFTITEDDLRKHRFDRVRLEMQCG
jgi:uncharacterized protein (TIGR02996 family)